MPNNDSHQHVVKTSEQWNERIVEFWVVPRGCLCVELTPRGKTKLKIGEGNKYYSQLPYICDDDLSQYYTKTEVDNLLENFNRMAIMSTEEYDEKSDLPLTGNKLGDVRFVKSQNPSIKIDPDIYLWNGLRWVFVGDKFPDIDLSNYLKKTEFHELFDPVSEKVDEMYPMRHTHENKAVLDQITAPFTVPEKEKLAGLENYDDTEIRELIQETGHTHPNKELLDTITSDSLWSNSDREKFDSLHNYDDAEVKVRIEVLESKSHTHENKEILDQITAPFTTEDKTKLDSLHNDEVFRGTDGMYPGTSGNVPAPSTLDIGKFLSSDGTWKPAGYDIDFIGATPYADGVHGLVPAPLMGEQSYFLRGDGTWAKVKSGGDKYKAGEGIYILSGETTSDTFPFEVYSRAETLKQYIIYGNVGGVGNPVGSSYHIPVVVSAPGHPNRTSTIVIDDPMYDGDYIDFEKQVFAHYRTDITSQIRNYATDETQRGINSEGVIYYKRAYEGWGGAPRISDYFEIDPNASYEISPVHSDSDFSDSLNVNVYDENHNRTRTIITSTTDATLFVPMSGEKYIRQSYVGDTGLLSLLKPVETPCILQNVVLYPNAINTIDVDTSIKPREIYVEVDEPIDPDPDDPMSQYSGIIYNDGVIDVTQDDPNNMNVLTFHYRDDVTKDITIDTGVTECVVDITQEDPTNLNELTISYADGTTNVITIPGGSGSDYAAGDGIEFTTSDLPAGYIQLEYAESFGTQSYIDTGVSHGFTAYMDLQYTASNHRQLMGVGLGSGMYFGSNASEEFEMYYAIAGTDTTQRNSIIWYHDEINPTRLEVAGESITDTDPGTSSNTFKIFSPFTSDGYGSSVKIYSVDIYDNNNTLIRRFIPCQSPSNIVGMYDSVNDVFYPPTGASLIAGRPLGDVTINAKLGNGLTFDSNDAIELDETTKFIFNCNNDNS